MTPDNAQADPLSETREVLFEGTELAAKAAQLAKPAAIYEFVHNTHEYALYHGSRSNSINTFLGRRGSDVDIARCSLPCAAHKASRHVTPWEPSACRPRTWPTGWACTTPAWRRPS
ncbi:MAG: hypothetical protein SWH68_02130 [Thermodesulfobacteriota bacterium]|nr:hypothetical protein [Thermodesulfobacteriota bacterium]